MNPAGLVSPVHGALLRSRAITRLKEHFPHLWLLVSCARAGMNCPRYDAAPDKSG